MGAGLIAVQGVCGGQNLEDSAVADGQGVMVQDHAFRFYRYHPAGTDQRVDAHSSLET